VRATGRPVTVLEAGAADRVRPGSRAIFLHTVTLQVFERLSPGLGRRLASHGLAWATKRTLYRGREIYQRTYPLPAPGTIPAATSLPQVVTEQVLLDACLSAGVEFQWKTEVSRVVPGGDAVGIDVGGRAALAARYVIGADGSRSVVRESAGLRLEGPRTSNAYVIVDIAEDAFAPLPLERVFHYEHPAVDYRNVLFVPFAGHWRVDLQCHRGDDPDALGSDAGVRTWLSAVMPARYADRVTWVSTYVFRQAIANAFTDTTHRILLAGEAGHVFAPFGARGLNSGVADAFVAAHAIDAALKAASQPEADARIVEFAESRREAAARNRAASSTALRHLQAASPLQRLVRLAAARAAPVVPAAGRWLDKAPFGPTLGAADRFGMYY
jgi:3-(3-hydroxy-phenyl)propionate hydroxylase